LARLLSMRDTIGVSLCLVGLIFTGIYEYVLIFGPLLKPDTTYREIQTVLGREVSSKIIHTVSREEAKRRAIELFLAGLGMLASGLAVFLMAEPLVTSSGWSHRQDKCRDGPDSQAMKR